MGLVEELGQLPPDEASGLLDYLRDPRRSLLDNAMVQNQEDEQLVQYDPFGLTDEMQSTILSYAADPPRDPDNGNTLWLVVLAGRQGGKSFSAAAACYPLAAYTPAWDHGTMADKRDRAAELNRRLHLIHNNWPEELRSPTVGSKERRQLTFDPEVGLGGKMTILSSQEGAAGVGRGFSSFHGSELGFWDDGTRVWTLLHPAMDNRKNSVMILECTPVPTDAPSAEFWKDIVGSASRREARWIYAFFPFWDVKLCRRVWPKGSKLDHEELKLLEKYGPLGLTQENLAFRRYQMEIDKEIRRNPALFPVFYPFDDVSCWLALAKGVIHESLLQKHLDRVLVPWSGTYVEYESPEPGVRYVIGVDSAGFGVRDHASYQVLKVFAGEWTQVACFADNVIDPHGFARKVYDAGLRWNTAEIVVERNGVGAAPIVLLEEWGYRNIYQGPDRLPGKNASGKANDEMLGWLADALKDELRLRDKDTVSQLTSYRNDKRTETGILAELVSGKIGKGRRHRSHWDKVSALQMAVVGAREGAQPSKPKVKPDLGNVKVFTGMTYNEQRRYLDGEDQRKLHQQPRGRFKYRSVRKKR